MKIQVECNVPCDKYGKYNKYIGKYYCVNTKLVINEFGICNDHDTKNGEELETEIKNYKKV